jgi:hypothetical protein
VRGEGLQGGFIGRDNAGIGGEPQLQSVEVVPPLLLLPPTTSPVSTRSCCPLRHSCQPRAPPLRRCRAIFRYRLLWTPDMPAITAAAARHEEVTGHRGAKEASAAAHQRTPSGLGGEEPSAVTDVPAAGHRKALWPPGNREG